MYMKSPIYNFHIILGKIDICIWIVLCKIVFPTFFCLFGKCSRSAIVFHTNSIFCILFGLVLVCYSEPFLPTSFVKHVIKSFIFCTGANQQSGKWCVWQSTGERWRQTESWWQDTSKTKSPKQELRPVDTLLLLPQRPLLTRPSVTFLFQHYI